MRGAKCVATHVREHLQLPLHRAVIEGRAERAQIVVQADAADLDRLAVEVETGIGSEDERSKTDARGVFIALPLAAQHT